ncbi:MAG: hypothetical protein IKE64_05500, partial [Thermoguttaceae bacterium]|nr:hypothetical protein [Thermoguttaceae bacterium]
LTIGGVTIDSIRETTAYGVIFHQSGGSISINSGTIVSNCGTDNTGGVAYVGGGTFTVGANLTDDAAVRFTGNWGAKYGGVIYADGEFASVTISGGTFESNSANYGGVIYGTNNGAVTIDGGTFSDNGAAYGGVVYAENGVTVTVNGGEVSGNSATGGGVIYADGAASVTVSGGTFTRNRTCDNPTDGGGGGVIYAEGASASVTISGGVFERNQSAYGGGVVFLENGGTLEVSGGEFSGNVVDYRGGGAIYANGVSASITISDGSFLSNTAPRGGVICADCVSADVTISGGTFSGNYVNYGGIVYLENGGTLDITGGTFSYNTASSNGGVIYANATSAVVTISVGTFSYNFAYKGGGVVFLNGGTLDIGGGTFSDNVADYATSGGVVYADGGRITISAGTFLNNRATRGGAVVWANRGTVTISNGTFSHNFAYSMGGGVVFLNGGTLDISGGTFSGNVADQAASGGVVYADGGRITISAGTFLDNYGYKGGVVSANGAAAVTISDGTFGAAATSQDPQRDGNRALQGGVLFLRGATADINGGTFSWNLAADNSTSPTTYGLGGVIYATNDSQNDAVVNIKGAAFQNNTALYGGVIFTEVQSGSSSAAPVTVNLAGVTMNYNSAAANGGAIANGAGAVVTDTDATYGDIAAVKTFKGNSAVNGGAVLNSGEFTLSNAKFTGNYSSGNGGAVDNLADGTLTLTGAAFSGNSSLGSTTPVNQIDWAGSDLGTGDGGAIQNWGTAELIDAYFTGNSAHDGGAIANGAGATMTLSQTTASGDGAPLGFSGNSAVYGGAIINVGTLTRAADQTAEIVFTGNSSYSNGGAISNSDNNGQAAEGSLGLYKAAFTDNTAGNASKTGSGGAIVSAKTLMITSSYFTDNSAVGGGKGGAVDQVAGALTLIGDQFSGNSASGGFGGAVNTWTGGVIAGVFTGNSAKFGGAVSVLGNDTATTIADTSLSGNSAASYGGAVYASGTVVIDGAAISNNTASLGGGVMAITSNISDTSVPMMGRGKVIFTGEETTFSGNTAVKKVGGQSVGSDLCASSSNSAAGNGAVIEIETMPELNSGGYALAVDRSILVLAGGATLPATVSVYSNKEFTCGYTYSGNTLAFTSLSSASGIDKWKIYWDGSASGPYTEYTAGGTDLPSGTVTGGTAVLIKGYKGTAETLYYMVPTSSASTSGAAEALFDDTLFDTQVFEWLSQEDTAPEEYCDDLFL